MKNIQKILKTLGSRPCSLLLLLPVLLAGCGQADVQSLKQTIDKQQAELKESQATIAALKAENAELKKQNGAPKTTPVNGSAGRKFSIQTGTGKTFTEGFFHSANTSASDLKPASIRFNIEGASFDLNFDTVKKLELKEVIPEGPKTYGWAAAVVTVTTTDNKTVTGKCNPSLYLHVILPESFSAASLAGLFKPAEKSADNLRSTLPADFKEINGKKTLAIPVMQIQRITFD